LYLIVTTGVLIARHHPGNPSTGARPASFVIKNHTIGGDSDRCCIASTTADPVRHIHCGGATEWQWSRATVVTDALASSQVARALFL